MDIKTIQHYQLGITPDTAFCTELEEIQQVTLTMIQQTERCLDILTRDFDPTIYDNTECCKAVEQLALKGRYSRIRVLIHEPRQVVQDGHQVLELGKRLSSFFQFRKPSRQHQFIAETFLIADEIGVIHRPYPDSYKTTVSFNDSMRAIELTKLFNEIWERAELDPNLRYFTL